MPRALRGRPVSALAVVAAALALASVAAGCGDGSTSPDLSGAPPMQGDTMPADSMASNQALTDEDVLALAQGDSTWTWWKFSDVLLDRAGNSPHGEKIRVRYNTQAATQLDAVGRVGPAASFPDRSAVVKEVHAGGAPVGLLVMYKAVGDPNAGHGAWLWAEYDRDGTVLHSIADNDSECHNCHVTGVDHMRMNDTH